MTKPVSFACLSARQPWASLLVLGIKDYENRSWQCAYRGPLLVHAGKTWGKDEQAAHDELLQIAIDHGDMVRAEILQWSKSVLGCIVGAVTMTGCVPREWWERRGRPLYDGWQNWFCGPYGWKIEDAVAFNQVIPFRGQQGLFRIPCGALANRISGDDYEKILGYFHTR